MPILPRALRFAQTYYNVGCPSQHFCLLRCLDIVAPVMLIQRKRSDLEVAWKTFALVLMLTHVLGLFYDLGRQSDIRAGMDIFSMTILFITVYLRAISLRSFLPEIAALERLDSNRMFRVGVPYADAIRYEVVHKDNVYLGRVIVIHFFTVLLYVVQNLTMRESFVTLITYWPTDLSTISPVLDKFVQGVYLLTAIIWGWMHSTSQFTIIVLMRMAIGEFRVFLHSLATLDEQIKAAVEAANPATTREQLVRALLDEHAQQHRNLIVAMMKLRAILRPYTLIHFSFYMTIMAAFITRMVIITGTSSLGMAIPVLITVIFFLETFGLCLLVEQLIQLNRKVAFTLYSYDWPACLPFGRSIKRTMMLMIMQANNTVDFSAGGLTTVSVELFASSCRLIYSMTMAMANMTSTGA